MAKSSAQFKVSVGADTGEYTKGMNYVKKTTKSTAQSVQGTLGGMAQGVRTNIKAMTAQFAAITGAIAAVGNAMGTIIEFEKANSTLASIMGKSTAELKNMAEAAKQLGATTAYTSSEVTGLQIELAKLGFSEKQILGMEKAVLNFATAVGTDLSSAAALSGAALRGFGLSANDAEDALGTLALGTTKSALSFDYINNGLATIMPVAKSFGLGIKDVTALLGALANKGFDASSAATAGRNIILYLADANSKLNKAIGSQPKSFGDIVTAFKALRDRGIDLNESLAVTDKRAVAAFSALVDGADDLGVLRQELEDTNGVMQTMADERLNNVAGAITILKSAWDGLVMSLENSKGTVKSIIDLTTDLVNFTHELIDPSFGVNSGAEKYFKQFSEFAQQYGEEAGIKFGYGMVKAAEKTAQENKRSKAGEWFGQLFNPGMMTAEEYQKDIEARRQAYQKWLDTLEKGEAVNDAVTTSIEDEGTAAELTAAQIRRLAAEEKKRLKEIEDMRKKGLTLASGVIASGVDMGSPLPKVDASLQTLKKIFAQGKAVSLSQPSLAPNTLDYANIKTIELGIIGKIKIDHDNIKEQIYDLQPIIEDSINGMSELMGGLIGDLATGGDAWRNFGNSALSAMGDMAIMVGKIAVQAGLATDGIKAALTLGGGTVAIAAGAALIALGTAVKTGLSNASVGNYSAGASSASGVASTSYSPSSAAFERSMELKVVGTLKADGNQLVAVLNNETNRRNISA